MKIKHTILEFLIINPDYLFYQTMFGKEFCIMKRFLFKDRILIGITLFSMFFGAGNLIFPPFLGARAGTQTWSAFLGFVVSAVFLPILGVVAVTKSGGLKTLSSRVHPYFSFWYILIVYLAIGPCLAIPRTASTSFSIAVQPFWNSSHTLWIAQFFYSALFFILAVKVAMSPEKLTEYLGKRLTPLLLLLIVVIFSASCIQPAHKIAPAHSLYQSHALSQGFLDGYQTMDTLAALNFGLIVSMNIREKGILDEKYVMKETIYAGWIAGIFLFFVYGFLTFVGMISSEYFPDPTNGTETLSNMVQFLFGHSGSFILAIIFIIACFNTCVSLFCCCGNYFSSVFPSIDYKKWVYIFAVVSFLISNIGLNTILTFSIPILNMMYPLAILLIFLSCIHHYIYRFPKVYPYASLFCGISSIIMVLEKQGFSIPFFTAFIKKMPGFASGFAWIFPSIVGIVIGILISIFKIPKKDKYIF